MSGKGESWAAQLNPVKAGLWAVPAGLDPLTTHLAAEQVASVDGLPGQGGRRPPDEVRLEGDGAFGQASLWGAVGHAELLSATAAAVASGWYAASGDAEVVQGSWKGLRQSITAGPAQVATTGRWPGRATPKQFFGYELLQMPLGEPGGGPSSFVHAGKKASLWVFDGPATEPIRPSSTARCTRALADKAVVRGGAHWTK